MTINEMEREFKLKELQNLDESFSDVLKKLKSVPSKLINKWKDLIDHAKGKTSVKESGILEFNFSFGRSKNKLSVADIEEACTYCKNASGINLKRIEKVQEASTKYLSKALKTNDKNKLDSIFNDVGDEYDKINDEIKRMMDNCKGYEIGKMSYYSKKLESFNRRDYNKEELAEVKEKAKKCHSELDKLWDESIKIYNDCNALGMMYGTKTGKLDRSSYQYEVCHAILEYFCKCSYVEAGYTVDDIKYYICDLERIFN